MQPDYRLTKLSVKGHRVFTRRRFFQGSLCAAATSIGLQCNESANLWAADETPASHRPEKSKPDVIIYDGSYPGWPWVASAADGTLYCVFREGTIHGYSANGRVMFTLSTDRGRSWSKVKTIVDEPNVDDRNAAITVLHNGELLVVYNRYTADIKSVAMAVRSTDGGKTWAKPNPLDMTNTRTRSAPIELGDGTVVLPYYVAPGNGALAALSNDAGRHWKTIRIPNADGFLGDEWDVAEVSSGQLVGIFRNSFRDADGTFWMSQSHDGGRTWTVPKPTNIKDQRSRSPANIVLQGKRPTVIYADHRMVSVSAVRSLDTKFQRWDLEHRLLCYKYNADDRPIRDGSYPSSAKIGPRHRLVVDYEIRERSRRITGYFVEFPRNW